MKIREGKKEVQISARVAKQIELLKKYYDIDIENRIIYLSLHYDSVSDVLANDVSIKEHPQFANTILQRIGELMDTFPADFDVDLKLTFNDYEGYDPEILMTSFKDSMEAFHYSCYKEKKNTWLLSAILIIISASLIGFRLFAIKAGIISGEEILQEMIDICGWVFLWEAVSLLFIQENEKLSLSKKVLYHLANISFLDSEGHVVKHINKNELTSTWVFETKKVRNGRILLLISGAACLAFGIIKFFDGVNNLIIALKPIEELTSEAAKQTLSTQNLFSEMGAYFLQAAFFAVAGIGALNMFREKGRLQGIVPIFAWLMFVFDVTFTVLSIIYLTTLQGVTVGKIFSIFTNIISTVGISILYFIGYRILRKNKRVSLSSLIQ